MKKVLKCFLYTILFAFAISIGAIPTYLHFTDHYEISINGKENITVSLNDKYIDEGVTVTNRGKIVDNYDTINNVDTSEPGLYEVLYKIDDIEKVRTVEVVDNTPPEIKLVRGKQYIINSNVSLLDYIEVSDNYDKEKIDVKVEGEYDLGKEGLYTIKYIAKDSKGNESSLETQIDVQEKNTSGIPVLMYHWFYDDTKGETYGTTNSHNYISKTEFDKQLQFLKDENYYFPTWSELIDYIDGKIVLPRKSVILTFDDCANSFFEVALKSAQEYEIPVTSFCITNKTNWQKHINEPFLDFESHTDSLHVRKCDTKPNGAVMCTDYDTIVEDIKTSIEKVKNNYAFAYPFGHYNEDTIEALKANDIKLAFTTNSGRVKKGANKYLLPRVRISRDTSIEKYKGLVK